MSTLSTNVPNNQQQIDMLMIGPTLHFRVADTLRGQAELRSTDSDPFHTTGHTYVIEVDRKLLLDDLTARLHSSFRVPPTSTPP